MLSVVVLCYRAGTTLPQVLEPLYAQLAAADLSFELVLVANYWSASDDPTPAIAASFAETHHNVVCIAREKHGGMGWDMRSGLAAASGKVLVVLDGDAQNPVADVLRIFDALRNSHFDVMKGRRVLRHDGAYRRLVSITYNVAFRLLFGTRGLWDINGKPKALTREAYEQLELTSDDWFIDAEIVLKARERGLAVGEVPVEFFRNVERESFVDMRAIGEFVVNMLRRRFGGLAK